MVLQFVSRMGLMSALGLSTVVAVARSDDRTIPLDQVPNTVLVTIQTKYPEARIQRVEEEQEHGRALYDVDLIEQGRDLDLMIAPDGTVLRVERELDPENLPRVVVDAIKTHDFGTIRWAEETTRGSQHDYEVIVAKADQPMRVVELDAQGKVLDVDDD